MTSKAFKDYGVITLGVALTAFGIVVFYGRNGLVTGGVGGLSIIIYELTGRHLGAGVPIWVSNLALNLPIFAVAAKCFGLKYLAKTIYTVAMLTFMLFLADFVPNIAPEDMVLVVVYGAVITGLGIGLVFSRMSTTGGTATLASLINLKMRHISIAKIMLVLDAMVITLGLLTFDAERTMYAIITVFISVKVIDSFLEGMDFAKGAFIITTKSEEVAQRIFADIGRGVTRLGGQGMYSKQDRDVLLCIVSNKQIVVLKEAIHQSDPAAFVVITNVREVLGQGFKEAGLLGNAGR